MIALMALVNINIYALWVIKIIIIETFFPNS